MSEPTPEIARDALRLQRAIDRRLDRVVRLGQELVDARLFGARNHAGLLREAHLRNAVALANETPSLEVLKNWIRYQIGRPDGRGWQHERFGQGVIEQIEGELDRLAVEVAAEAAVLERQHEAALRLTRLYLGYLHRHFSYREHERQQERERERRAGAARPARPPASPRPPSPAAPPTAAAAQAPAAPSPSRPSASAEATGDAHPSAMPTVDTTMRPSASPEAAGDTTSATVAAQEADRPERATPGDVRPEAASSAAAPHTGAAPSPTVAGSADNSAAGDVAPPVPTLSPPAETARDV